MNTPRKEGVEVYEPPTEATTEEILAALQLGDFKLQGLMPWSSNYTFLGTVTYQELYFSTIYKPCRGERPLWDFDHGTLCQREVASYEIGAAIGNWQPVPPTVLRDGPHGRGSMQQFIITDYDIHYFTIQDDPRFTDQFQQLALLDYIINNADRKGGHCLLSDDNKVWGIDNGLSFHTDYKLRTVIWEYAGESIPYSLYQDLKTFRQTLQPKADLYNRLNQLLTPREIEFTCRRLESLLKSGQFPEPYGMRDYPYPPV